MLMSRKSLNTVKNSLNKEKRYNAYKQNSRLGQFHGKKCGKKKNPS